MDLEHPLITNARLTGYSTNDQEVYEYDVLGNAIYLYDDVIAMPEGVYRLENLSYEQVDYLLDNGGIYQQIE